jgi:hypothetical protein
MEKMRRAGREAPEKSTRSESLFAGLRLQEQEKAKQRSKPNL